MVGNIFHVQALGKQIINIAIYGIIDNLGHPILSQAHPGADFLLGPAQAVQADDDGLPAGCLPGPDICDPGVQPIISSFYWLDKSC